jgi:hypothetical protein
MYAKPVHYSKLPKTAPEYPVFRLAEMANSDTWHGGSNASYIASRAKSMGLPKAWDFQAAVSDVYAASTGRVPDHLRPHECMECGCVYADRDAAAICCSEYEDGDTETID